MINNRNSHKNAQNEELINQLKNKLQQKENKIKEYKKTLDLEKAFLQSLLKFSSDALYFKDLKSRFVRISDTLAKAFGLKDPAKAIGKTDFDFFAKKNAQLFFDDEQEIIKSGNPVVDIEEEEIKKSGRVTWASTSKMPLRDLQGNIIGTIGISRDITDRKQTEFEREQLLAELEAKNTELERFTYTVSHDLKSPLVTIQGFLGMLKQDALSGNQEALKEDILEIQKAAKKMKELLDELLVLSRIGRIINCHEEVSLVKLVNEALDVLAGKVVEHNIRIDVNPELPTIYGDRTRLVEVLQNLIENAIKFIGDQPEPLIEIGMRNKDDETVLFVRDNGIGIDPKYQTRVFGLFEQLNTGKEGTGIGLAIVKRIIESHNGLIWVESEGLGKGTTFCIVIPKREDIEKQEE